MLNLLLLVGNLVRYGSKVGVGHILPLLPALLPSMLTYSLPMATLTATISTLSGARQLNEPMTLASNGISLFQLMPPFVVLGFALCLLNGVSFQWLQPWSEGYKHQYLTSLGANLLESELKKPQTTLDLGQARVNLFEGGEGQRSAIIQHRKEGRITKEVFAPQARVEVDRENKEVAIHTQGSIRVVSYEGQHFGHATLDSVVPVRLPFKEKFRGKGSLRQWPLTRMWLAIQTGTHKKLNKLKAYFYEKLSLTLSPLLLVIAAFPLGFAGKDSSRITGFLLGLGLIFLVYYPLLIVGKKVTTSGAPLPWMWMQLPNLALLVLGIWGCRRLDGRI